MFTLLFIIISICNASMLDVDATWTDQIKISEYSYVNDDPVVKKTEADVLKDILNLGVMHVITIVQGDYLILYLVKLLN